MFLSRTWRRSWVRNPDKSTSGLSKCWLRPKKPFSSAVEQLRLLLKWNADFQSRVEMLPANRRLLESLEKLEKIFPEDVRVTAALAVTRARFFAEQGNWQRAIAEYSKLITDQTADANLLAKRAKIYEATQRWDLARADWRRAIEQQPDLAQAVFDNYRQAERWSEAAEFGLMLAEEKPEDSLLWLHVAPVLVLAGDDADYPAYCLRIVEQFAESKTVDVPDKVVKACLLRPEAIELSKLPLDQFAASLDEGTAPDWYPVWAWGTQALLAYRGGDAASAVKYVTRSEDLMPGDLTHALNLAVLAMAQHQLQHPDEARRALAEAVELTDRPQSDAGSNGDFDLLIAQILLREAQALINGKTQPKPAGEETDATGDKTP
jgi:tetratricopeptide (TPR) repeat protein